MACSPASFARRDGSKWQLLTPAQQSWPGYTLLSIWATSPYSATDVSHFSENRRFTIGRASSSTGVKQYCRHMSAVPNAPQTRHSRVGRASSPQPFRRARCPSYARRDKRDAYPTRMRKDFLAALYFPDLIALAIFDHFSKKGVHVEDEHQLIPIFDNAAQEALK